MIKIKYRKVNDQLSKIDLSGHAKYADYGNDIVCAAVSSIVTTTVNGIIAINPKAISYEENDLFKIINQSFDQVTNTLLDNMLSLLIELSKDYPKNIEIREEEK